MLKVLSRRTQVSACLINFEPFIYRCFQLRRNMTTDEAEQHWISRLNKQVNYKRRFISPEKVEVIIPTLPYQAFDLYLSGTRIKPWNLIDLVVSTRLFTQYPVEHTGNPGDSIVDTHHLQKEHFLFSVALKMDINRTFHDPEMPKFPLHAEVEVTHVGRSSSRRVYNIKHPDNPTPYITCAVDDVIVNKTSRQPTPFPDWWQQKYSYLERPKVNFEKLKEIPDSVSGRSEVQVEFEHMDHNLHTTMSAYLKYCINAAFKIITHENYEGHLSSAYLGAGVKCIQMFFHSESNYGDTLIMEMLESSSKENEVYFKIKKRTASQEKEIECCFVVIEFYKPGSTADAKL